MAVFGLAEVGQSIVRAACSLSVRLCSAGLGLAGCAFCTHSTALAGAARNIAAGSAQTSSPPPFISTLKRVRQFLRRLSAQKLVTGHQVPFLRSQEPRPCPILHSTTACFPLIVPVLEISALVHHPFSASVCLSISLAQTPLSPLRQLAAAFVGARLLAGR